MCDEMRIPKLEGGCNLRELGGYRSEDGRHVRYGVLFRSGVLTYLTPGDHARLAELGIRTICDLRRADEIQSEPTQWIAPVRKLSWPLDVHTAQSQRAAPWERSTSASRARAAMYEAYTGMTRWLIAPLRGIFQTAIDGEAPLLFHCAAGKDRTGFCAGVLLHALGVPRATILTEYELTNRAVDLYHFALTHQRAQLGLTDVHHPLEEMPADVRLALLTADRCYLLAAFDKIEREYGSLDAYIDSALGFGVADLHELRHRFLSSETLPQPGGTFE